MPAKTEPKPDEASPLSMAEQIEAVKLELELARLRNELAVWSADAPQPSNVIEALAAVMRDVEGIGKDGKSEQGYRYRGIEQITAALQPLLGKYGVVFVPQVTGRWTKDLTVNNKPWTEEQFTIEYTVYGPGGVTDFIKVGPIFGFGRDNSDKGANKAMSQAFKYALLQTLCIGDSKDDGDQQTHATDSGPESTRPKLTPLEQVKADATKLKGGARDAFVAILEDAGVDRTPKNWTEADGKLLRFWLDHLAATGEAVTTLGDLQTTLTPDQLAELDAAEPEQDEDGKAGHATEETSPESLPDAAPEQ